MTCHDGRCSPVALVDGRQVCTYSEEWRHECECRQVLAMPTLAARRRYLYGEPDQWGKFRNGIEAKRGKDALKAMEATMMALWRKNNQAA